MVKGGAKVASVSLRVFLVVAALLSPPKLLAQTPSDDCTRHRPNRAPVLRIGSATDLRIRPGQTWEAAPGMSHSKRTLRALWFAAAVAFTAQAAAECPEAHPNHPPVLLGSRFEYVRIRPGRAWNAELRARDEDGDSVTYRVDPNGDTLPEGASLNENRGTLSWTPRSDQLGLYQLRIIVSDGRAEAQVTFVVTVRPNRPPLGKSMLSQRVDDYDQRRPRSSLDYLYEQPGILAHDPDGDPVTVRTRSAPPGMTIFVAEPSRVEFYWRPTEVDVGDHVLIYEVSDGETTTELRTRVRVVPPAPEGPVTYRGAWTGILIPGVGATGFLSRQDGELFLGLRFRPSCGHYSRVALGVS